MDRSICESCKTYQQEKEKALNSNNSAYDAAVDMWLFTEECSKTCSLQAKAESKV